MNIALAPAGLFDNGGNPARESFSSANIIRSEFGKLTPVTGLNLPDAGVESRPSVLVYCLAGALLLSFFLYSLNPRRLFYGKRGQLTIFIILAFVVVIAVFTIAYLESIQIEEEQEP